MPELPEVETIRRGLHDYIQGKALVGISWLDGVKTNAPTEEVTALLSEQRISSIDRRGKVLIWSFSNDYSLLFHLKMTGQVIADAPAGTSVSRFAGGHPTKSMDIVSRLPDSSTRAVFEFEDGTRVYFNDQRKFGWIKLVKTAEVFNESLLKTMGPEPDTLNDVAAQQAVKDKLRRTSRPIKAAILDQGVVAGVGNIYADESLHLARIHPTHISKQLTEQQMDELLRAIQEVIARSIELGGTSFTNYVNVLGTRGDYLETSRVFKREGLNCRECGTEIIKTRGAGRGTHICPSCQKVQVG